MAWLEALMGEFLIASSFQQFVLRLLWGRGISAALLIMCACMLSGNCLLKRLVNPERAKILKYIVRISSWLNWIALPLAFASLILHVTAVCYGYGSWPHIIPSLFVLGLMVVSLQWTWRRWRLIAHVQPAELVAWFYMDRSRHFLKEDRDEEASDAIVRACEADPEGVLPWAMRASRTLISGGDIALAQNYMDRAQSNLANRPELSRDMRAEYEFYAGHLCMRRYEFDAAAKHVRQSIELRPDEERERILRKLEALLQDNEDDDGEEPDEF